MTTTGRCMKCKEQVEIQEAVEITMKNGRRAMQGKCGKCGTKVFKILGAAKTATETVHVSS